MSDDAPIHVTRFGELKANIWGNEGKHGTFLKTTLAKTYRRDGKAQDTNAFTEKDLLLLPELSKRAYDDVQILKKELGLTPEPEQSFEDRKQQLRDRIKAQREDRERNQNRER